VPILLRQVSPAKLFAGILIPYFVPKRDESKQNKSERAAFSFSLIQKITAITVWPMAILGFAFAEDIIVGIFGNDFAEGVVAMQVLIGFMIIQTAADIFYNLAIALEESRLMFMSSLWGIANVCVNLVFIPLWGVTGAAFGTGIVTIGIYTYFNYAFAKKGWLFFYPWQDNLKVLLSLLPLLLLLLVSFVNEVELIFKILFVFAGLGVYLIMVRMRSPFNYAEKNIISERFGRPAIVIIKEV
jgi:O-antigen/teichoic acid export membrane protein